MEKYTFISPNCLTTGLYTFRLNRQYDNPLVANLFVSDMEYVKFCKYFDYYIRLKPVFIDKPRLTTEWAKDKDGDLKWKTSIDSDTNYFITLHNDIEIHWLHAKSKDEIIDKWNRRLNRYLVNNKKPVFLWSVADFLQDHEQKDRDNIIRDFLSIPTSMFITNREDDVEKFSACNGRIIPCSNWYNKPLTRTWEGLYDLSSLSELQDLWSYVICNDFTF